MRPVALLLTIAACGTSGGDDDGGTTIPAGVYSGTGTFSGSELINGAKHTFSTAPTIVAVVTTTGNYLVLSETLGAPMIISQIDLGTGVANGMFTAPNNDEFGLYPDYNSNNFALLPANQNAMFAASFQTGASLDGTITYSGTSGDVLMYALSFVAGSTAPPAALPTTIAGTFYSTINTGQAIDLSATSSLTITGTAVSGTVTCPLMSVSPPPQPTPCTVTGTLSPRTDVAAFDVTLSFANGNGNSFPSAWTGVTATGLAYFDGTRLQLGATIGTTAFGFSN